MMKSPHPSQAPLFPNGARVRVLIADPSRYAVGCAAALDRRTGTIERTAAVSYNGDPSPGPAQLDGTRCVLHLGQGGTWSVPIASLSDEQLRAKLPSSVRRGLR